MKKWVMGIWFLHLAGGFLLAQGDLADKPRIFYRNEKTLGILLNSNGWGVSGRYAKRLNARNKTIYEVDIVNIKHAKELKISNSGYDNRSFIFGKENLFINFRGGWGKQKEIFRKIDRGGISIRRYFSLGPTIGVLKPIYYELYDYNEDSYVVEKFSSTIHTPNIIVGRASFFKGFNEIFVMPGIFGRFGMSFEYSTHDISIHAIETAVSLDLFPKRMEIMATQKSSFFFLTLSVSYRFGKVVDATGRVDTDKIAY